MSEEQWFLTLDSHLEIFKCHDSSRMAILDWRTGNKPQEIEPSHLLLQETLSCKTSLKNLEMIHSHTLLTSVVILCWSLLLHKYDKIKHETQKATIWRLVLVKKPGKSLTWEFVVYLDLPLYCRTELHVLICCISAWRSVWFQAQSRPAC